MHVGIRNHLRTVDTKVFQDAGLLTPPDQTADYPHDYESLLKEYFCVAASDLATAIQEPLVNLGVLFDNMVTTGIQNSSQLMTRLIPSKSARATDLEANSDISSSLFGSGQLLFLVRIASEHQALHLQSSGFMFTQQSYVIDRLASRMQLPKSEIESNLTRMREYASNEQALEPGIHLALFALRPLLSRGFDVLVRKDAQHLLPSVHLSSANLEPMHLNILTQLDGLTVTACKERLRHRSSFPDEYDFVFRLLCGIGQLSEYVGSDFMAEARLVAHLFKAPSPNGSASIIAFRVITDVHEFTKQAQHYEFAPLKFFITRQHTYKDSPDIKVFSQRIQNEFAHLNNNPQRPRKLSDTNTFLSPTKLQPKSVRSRRSYSPSPTNRKWSSLRCVSCTKVDDVASENQVVPSKAFSLNESHVHVKERSSVDSIELQKMKSRREEAVQHLEEESFAEKLVALTIDERKHRG